MRDEKISTLIMKLAERGISSNIAFGEGSPESRAAGLIMSAIDQLMTAAQLHPQFFYHVHHAIDILRRGVESLSRTQTKPARVSVYGKRTAFPRRTGRLGRNEEI